MTKQFQNLKISITDEVHLKAVCDVLESMGFTDFYDSKNWKCDMIRFVEVFEDRTYDCYNKDIVSDNAKQTTLTDLLRMRDAQALEKIHAAKTV